MKNKVPINIVESDGTWPSISVGILTAAKTLNAFEGKLGQRDMNVVKEITVPYQQEYQPTLKECFDGIVSFHIQPWIDVLAELNFVRISTPDCVGIDLAVPLYATTGEDYAQSINEPLNPDMFPGEDFPSTVLDNLFPVTELVDKTSTESVDSILAERGKEYGAFNEHARITQIIKGWINRQKWEELTYSQKEALDMIAHKIGRIVNGNPNNVDSWKDIAGYATLVANELEGRII